MLIKATLTIFLLVLMAAPSAAGDVFLTNAQTPKKQRPRGTRKINRYSCPMHPEVKSTPRGMCPKCGMRLRLMKDSPPATPAPATPTPESSASITFIPDVEVLDQDGKRLRFRTDLIDGKTVAINFIFTTCTAICPPLTATFRRVQQQLIEQKLPAQLISISVDPTTDTPERLREFAAKFKAEPGWTFVTGDKAAIDSILQALGTAVAVKTDHTPMVLIGNEAKGYWTRTYGLSSPSNLIKVIAEAAGK